MNSTESTTGLAPAGTVALIRTVLTDPVPAASQERVTGPSWRVPPIPGQLVVDPPSSVARFMVATAARLRASPRQASRRATINAIPSGGRAIPSRVRATTISTRVVPARGRMAHGRDYGVEACTKATRPGASKRTGPRGIRKARSVDLGPARQVRYGMQAVTPSVTAGPAGPPVPTNTPQVQVVPTAEAVAPHPVAVTFTSTTLTPSEGL